MRPKTLHRTTSLQAFGHSVLTSLIVPGASAPLWCILVLALTTAMRVARGAAACYKGNVAQTSRLCRRKHRLEACATFGIRKQATWEPGGSPSTVIVTWRLHVHCEPSTVYYLRCL